MSQLTKNAIVETTLRLSQQRPINKITVRDIVEACGITRNTFYYHFHDIYEVLECAIEVELERLRSSWSGNTEKSLFDLFKFCISYKKVWNNLYRSVGHEQLSVYISKQIKLLFTEQFLSHAEVERLDPRDVSLLSLCCEEMLTGIFFRWLRTDPPPMTDEELYAFASHILKIFEGQLQAAIRNCVKKV